MKRQRKQQRGHGKRIEKRLAKAASGKAVVVQSPWFDEWLRSYVA